MIAVMLSPISVFFIEISFAMNNTNIICDDIINDDPSAISKKLIYFQG